MGSFSCSVSTTSKMKARIITKRGELPWQDGQKFENRYGVVKTLKKLENNL